MTGTPSRKIEKANDLLEVYSVYFKFFTVCNFYTRYGVHIPLLHYLLLFFFPHILAPFIFQTALLLLPCVCLCLSFSLCLSSCYVYVCTWKSLLNSFERFSGNDLAVVLIYLACHNKMPQTVWLKQQTLFFPLHSLES